MNPEFDQYASAYSHLLQDPIRDRFASDSEFFHRRKWRLIQNFFAQQQIATSQMAWLDVGCGGGELLRLGADQFGQALGCDPSTAMIETCTSAEIYRQTSPTELPFPDASFEFVTAVCVYHHVHGEERAALTKSIYRVLKPGGVFCLVEHNPWNPVTRLIVRRCPIDVDAELLTASAASGLMKSANLVIMKMVYFLYFPGRTFKILSRIENYLGKLPLGGQFAMFCQKPR